MSLGRACGVQWNLQHEALHSDFPEFPAEAYCSSHLKFSAACGAYDCPFDPLISGRHSVNAEPDFRSVFSAGLLACQLRWEVLKDLSFLDLPVFRMHNPDTVPRRPRQRLSQVSHSNTSCGLRVRFDDCIDLFVGGEDSGCFTHFPIQHAHLSDWPDKPWSNRRIARVVPPWKSCIREAVPVTTSFFLPPVSTFFY